MFTVHHTTVTPYTKVNQIKEITCDMYPDGLLFGTNIIIDKILVFLTLCNPTNLEVPNIGFPCTYNTRHNTTQPNFM